MEPATPRLSRRLFLRRVGVGALGCASVALLAACGSSAATPTTAAQQTTSSAASSSAAGAASTTSAAASTAASSAATTTTATSAAASASSAATSAASTAASTASATTSAATTTEGAFKTGGTLTLSVAQKTSYSHFMFLRHYAGGENIYSRTLPNAKLLTINHEQTDFIPDLSEKWAFSPDGKQLTFTLRKGLKWHDGQPFTSKDVNFTYHMIGIPGLGSTLMGSIFSGYITGMQEWIDGKADKIAGLSTPDDLTVVFALDDAFSHLTLFSLFNQICIAPDHILHEYLDRDKGKNILQSEWATTAKHVGMGPFKVTEYVADQYIVYEPFADYYRGKPRLGKLIYRPFQDATTNAAALQNKEVDAGRIGAPDYPRFQKFDFLNFTTAKDPTYSGTPFNCRQPYLNQKVRQALMYAIDREAMVKTLYASAVDVVHSPISVPQYGDSPKLTKYNYDPEKAKQLLKEGGWEAGRKLRWAVAKVPDTEADQAYYAAINGYWSKVGVQTEYQVWGQDNSVLWGPKWDFDLYPSAYPIGIPATIAVHFDPRLASYVSAGYDTPEFRKLWDDAKIQHDDDAMKQIIWQLQEMMSDQCLGLMIARSVDIWGVNKRVHNLTPMYFGYEFNLYDWQMEKVWVDS